MNYKEVLKCLKMPNYVSNDFYSMLFARSIGGGAAGYDELTGAPPLTFTANGRNLIDYRIYGANDGVGERTGQLFDYENSNYQVGRYKNTNGIISTYPNAGYYAEYIPVEPNSEYFLSNVIGTDELALRIYFYDINKGWISRSAGYLSDFRVTTPSNCKYIQLQISETLQSSTNYMLNSGSTALPYEPYGYQINAVVRSENLFDIHKVFNQNTAYYIEDTIYITTGGLWYDILCFTSGASATPVVAKMIHVNAGTYTIKIGKVEKTSGSSVPVGFVLFTQDGRSITNVTNSYVLNESSKTFTLENDGYISLRVSEGRPTIQGLMIVEGSTAPTQYIPYSRTDIPIYIGDTPLAQGEYVDYRAQKVYKYVGGVLTPTDPPVALPALPTIDGKTIVDFDNTPKPSEVYVKYPK